MGFYRDLVKKTAAIFERSPQARYDAGTVSKRTKGWRSDGYSVNTETNRSLSLLRSRSRELHQNHWAAVRAKTLVQRNTVGSGIVPTIRDPSADNEFLHDVCRDTGLDPAGKKTLGALQSLSIGGVVESGEVLILRRWRSPSEMRQRGMMLPVQFDILEADHLDTFIQGPQPNGTYAIQGVEYDRRGWPVAYHLYRDHPGEVLRWNQYESVRVPASEVCHAFIELRPGQARGIPWAAPCMIKMRQLADYEDAQLQRAIIANAWAVFVHHTDDVNLDDLYDPSGVPTSVHPGMVEYLRPGESVEFANPPGAEGFRDFSEITAQHIAATYELTYPALTGDYGSMNFSSGRMGHVEMQRSIDVWQTQLMVAQVCRFFERSMRLGMQIMGRDPGESAWKWTPPRREMIDPVKETAALLTAVRGGLNTMPDALTQMGREPSDVVTEIVAWNELLDANGIILDSDPRRMSGGGQAQAAQTGDENDG